MRRLPPRSPLTAPLFPYTPLFRSALAGLAALAGGVVAAGLRLGLHAPQVRSDDGMGDHQAQRDLGMAGQGGTDGGMAVQVDIGLASAGHLGPGRLVAGVQRLALLDAARFLARQDRKSTRLNSSH